MVGPWTIGQLVKCAWGQGYGAGSALNVIATVDNTTVTITPHVNTPAGSNGLPAMTAGQPTQIAGRAWSIERSTCCWPTSK